MVLAGASVSGDWVKELKKKAAKLPVEFAVNASYEKLSNLYAAATIYWHAAGYGLDENKNPELVEHFGITTVEAIANGCVPLVVPYGGQREIVTNPELHWESIEELVQKTVNIAQSQDLKSYLSGLDISQYSENAFREALQEIISL